MRTTRRSTGNSEMGMEGNEDRLESLVGDLEDVGDL